MSRSDDPHVPELTCRVMIATGHGVLLDGKGLLNMWEPVGFLMRLLAFNKRFAPGTLFFPFGNCPHSPKVNIRCYSYIIWRCMLFPNYSVGSHGPGVMWLNKWAHKQHQKIRFSTDEQLPLLTALSVETFRNACQNTWVKMRWISIPVMPVWTGDARTMVQRDHRTGTFNYLSLLPRVN
jgi:hypothetical protein